MKKYLASMIGLLLAACGGTPDKAAELAELKEQEAALRGRIEKLEAEVAEGDSTNLVKSKTVTVTEMQPVPFSHFIEVQARVEGDEDVTVSAQAMGSITSLAVKPGDRVQRGQVLATVDDRTVRQSLESLKTQYEMAATVYRRQKNLWDQQIGSEIQYLDTKTRKESLERQVAALEEQWDLTRIKSPIDGTVDQVFIKTGQTVAPGLPAMRVVNLSRLKVSGEIAEGYISNVKKGNLVKLYVPDEGREVTASVNYAGRAINPLNRTFNVEVRLNPAHGTFYPNQVVVLKISDYVSPRAMVVPVGAVMKSGEGEFIFIADDYKSHPVARRKAVRTGQTYNGNTEITEGLAPGDKVVTFGYQNLVDGDVINY